MNRRSALSIGSAVVAGSTIKTTVADASQASPKESFRYCLNMSTLRGQKLSVPEQIRIAAAAGYRGIEPWIREIRGYLEAGERSATYGNRSLTPD